MSCKSCSLYNCPQQGTHATECEQYQFAEPQYEVYTFDERTGSERIHLFYTQAGADAFLKRQAPHLMAH
jgi:hypothetical protein